MTSNENIELLELNSPSTSTKTFIKSKFKISTNKVGSPLSSPPHPNTQDSDDSSHLFVAKSQLPPITNNKKKRHDIFEKPVDDTSDSLHSSTITDTTKSHREKFRERFESVKSLAGKSANKAGEIHNLKGRQSVLQKETNALEDLKSRNKTFDFPNNDSDNFFCKENISKEGNEEQKHGSDLANLHQSTDVLIEVLDTDEKNADLEFVGSCRLKFDFKQSEDEMLWYPSNKYIETMGRIASDEPKLQQKEGFYIGKKPRIPFSHINIVEQRLHAKNDKRWFNCDGNLEIEQDPYRNTSFKPQTYDINNPEFQLEYIAATSSHKQNSSETPNYNKILNVRIESLQFKHHPLFSPEHVFEQKLTMAFDEYKQKISTNKFVRIGKQLDALRNAKNIILASGDSTNQIQYDKIKKLRMLYFEEGKYIRSLLKMVLHTWKIIKKIRQNNNYSCTDIKLLIRKEKCDYEQEVLKREQELKETYSEMIFELEKQHKDKLKKQDHAIQSEQEPNSDISEPGMSGSGIDYDKILIKVEKMFDASLKAPGEPIIHLSISHDNEITENSNNEKEKLRKDAVAATKIYLKLFCNELQVCKSKPLQLTNKFVCFIDETFAIQASSIPKDIVIEIYEKNNFILKRKIGEAIIKVGLKKLKQKALEVQFEKHELVHYTHEGVGSGIELNNIIGHKDYTDEILNTSGAIGYKISWENFQQNNDDWNVGILNENGELDPSKLITWANDHQLDPQDPKNYLMYEYIKNYRDSFESTPRNPSQYFRLNPDMLPLNLNNEEVDNNLRFQVLTLRDRNEPEFIGMVVPNRLHEIPSTILDDYKIRMHEREDDTTKSNDRRDHEIDIKRSSGKKFLKQAYTKVFHQCRNSARSLVYEDIVNEKMIPHIEKFTKNIVTSLLNWIQRQPTLSILKYSNPLKPLRRAADTTLTTPAKITIIVRSAINIPKQNKTAASPNKTVRTFVIVTYKNVQLKTTTVEGTNPIWNEELVLPLEAKNIDYLSPYSFNGSVSFQLFEEVVVNTARGEMMTQSWLGTINVPISAILNNKMDGMFKLMKPNHLLGYEQETNINCSTTDIILEPTCLSLNIIFQPSIPKLTQDMRELETNELQSIKDYIVHWNDTYNNGYPSRKFSALCIDTYGKTTCVTRYIRALEPPQLNVDGFDVSAEECARYVSMIPFTDNNKFYENVWLSTEQVLKLMIGSIIDHAIMLACYLTFIDIETWLLIGYGHPQGSTAYVLTREYTKNFTAPKHYIYDTVTAKKYDLFNTYCPLKRIHCIINEHNVWANIQRTNQIHLTRLDFSMISDWWPLFNNHIRAPTNTIQQKLLYAVTPNVQGLELRIEKKIQNKLSKIRKYERTIWNHPLSRTFKNIITRCDLEFTHGRRNSELLLELQRINVTHSINGFIISLPYTTIPSILSMVQSSGIYVYEGTNTEFATAVHITNNPNHVLTVWICVAAITPR